MEDSPKDNRDTSQDKPEESGENPPAVENQSDTLSDQETLSPSTEEETSAKKREGTLECESGTENDAFASTLSPSAAARTLDGSSIITKAQKKRTVSPESEALESPTTSPTSSYKKRKIMKSSPGDSNDASIPTSADNMERHSYHLQTETAAPNVEESERTEDEPPREDADISKDPDCLTEHSNRDDLHPIGSLSNLPTEEHETNIHPSNFSNASADGSNKDSVQQKGDSPHSDSSSIVIYSPESPVGSSEVETIPTDRDPSLNPESISNPGNESTEDYKACPEMKTQKVSSGDSQSTLNMSHPATEIQMLESAPSELVIGNPQLPPSCHLPSSNSFSTVNDPCLELKTFDEKERSDQIPSDASTQTSKPNVKSTSELKKPSEQGGLEMLQGSRVDERSRTMNVLENRNAEIVQKIVECFILERQNSASIPSGLSTSKERSDVAMDQNPPDLNEHEGQPGTSSHQPVIPEGSAGHRSNSSSGILRSRVARARAIEWNTSSEGHSKYVLNVRLILLGVLEDIMEFNKEEHRYSRFEDLFHCVSEVACSEREKDLVIDLGLYMSQRTTYRMAKYLNSRVITLEYKIENIYEALIRIVFEVLLTTIAVPPEGCFDSQIRHYKSFKGLFATSSIKFKRSDKEIVKDEDPLRALINKMHRLLLQTGTAFKLLLMHIGENADQEFIDKNDKEIWVEDKLFFRRGFVSL